jgi:hypothetical protein
MTYEPVIFAMLMYAVIRINFKQFVDFQACDFGYGLFMDHVLFYCIFCLLIWLCLLVLIVSFRHLSAISTETLDNRKMMEI